MHRTLGFIGFCIASAACGGNVGDGAPNAAGESPPQPNQVVDPAVEPVVAQPTTPISTPTMAETAVPPIEPPIATPTPPVSEPPPWAVCLPKAHQTTALQSRPQKHPPHLC